MSNIQIAGDSQQDQLHLGAVVPSQYHLKFSDSFIEWMNEINSSIVFTTYEAGKIVMVGPSTGKARFAVSERSFGRAMAMAMTDDGFLLSIQHQLWRFQNCLKEDTITQDGWDRIFLPRQCHVTGGVDVHDIALDKHNKLMAVITLYNCVAQLDHRGNFNPVWKPEFIDRVINEDRCHLNGFCLVKDEVKYVTIVSASNTPNGWREHRADGGQVIDITTNKVIASGLAMPHSPRFYKNKLWILEAGTGWFGWINIKTGEFNKVAWVPGFARGLRFYGDYALVGISKPRHEIFSGLPLDDELKNRGREPEAGIYLINIKTGDVHATMNISGSVGEIYDVGVIPGSRAPFLAGTTGIEDKKMIFIGPDLTAEKL